MPKMPLRGIDNFPQAPEGYTPGKYHMRYESYEQQIAKDTRVFFKIKARIVEGPAAMDAKGNPIDYEGREFTLIVWPPDEALDRWPDTSKSKFRNFLEESGIPWDDEGYDPVDFVGCEAIVELAPQKSNPSMMEVKRYSAL